MQIIIESPGPTSRSLLGYTLLIPTCFVLPVTIYPCLGQFAACPDGAVGRDEAANGAAIQNTGLHGPPPDHGWHDSFTSVLDAGVGGHPNTPQHLVNTPTSTSE